MEFGNLTLAGHNYLNKTMFGALSQLAIGDIIEITDLYGITIEYKVFDIYVTTYDDTGVLDSIEDSRREITLFTCKNGNINRLVVRASEIQE